MSTEDIAKILERADVPHDVICAIATAIQALAINDSNELVRQYGDIDKFTTEEIQSNLANLAKDSAICKTLDDNYSKILGL